MNLLGTVFPNVVVLVRSEGENLAPRATPAAARRLRKIGVIPGAILNADEDRPRRSCTQSASRASIRCPGNAL